MIYSKWRWIKESKFNMLRNWTLDLTWHRYQSNCKKIYQSMCKLNLGRNDAFGDVNLIADELRDWWKSDDYRTRGSFILGDNRDSGTKTWLNLGMRIIDDCVKE